MTLVVGGVGEDGGVSVFPLRVVIGAGWWCVSVGDGVCESASAEQRQQQRHVRIRRVTVTTAATRVVNRAVTRAPTSVGDRAIKAV